MKNDNELMIPEFIKNRIELKFGKQVRYPKDCEALAMSISNYCNEKISSATLMRLFGLTKKGPNQARLFTLDLIAQYIGFNCWEEAVNEEHLSDNSYFENIEKIAISGLGKEQIVSVKYSPDRAVKIKYLGDNDFQVVESVKSKLQKDDILKILRLELTYPIVCENVTRNSKSLGKFVGGKEDGIMQLSIDL